MDKQEVIQAIGKPTRVIGAKKFNDGILEIYEYDLYRYITDSLDKSSWLFFFNDKLQEFGDKNEYIPNEYDRYYRRFHEQWR